CENVHVTPPRSVTEDAMLMGAGPASGVGLIPVSVAAPSVLPPPPSSWEVLASPTPPSRPGVPELLDEHADNSTRTEASVVRMGVAPVDWAACGGADGVWKEYGAPHAV